HRPLRPLRLPGTGYCELRKTPVDFAKRSRPSTLNPKLAASCTLRRRRSLSVTPLTPYLALPAVGRDPPCHQPRPRRPLSAPCPPPVPSPCVPLGAKGSQRWPNGEEIERPWRPRASPCAAVPTWEAASVTRPRPRPLPLRPGIFDTPAAPLH